MLIKCPSCSFSREVDDQQVPAGDTPVACPKCKQGFILRKPDPFKPLRLIKCPNCSFACEVDDQWVPVGDSQVVCPQCKQSFILSKPDPAEQNFSFHRIEPTAGEAGPKPPGAQPAQARRPPGQSGPDQAATEAPVGSIPWEDPSQDLCPAYLATLKMVMLDPPRFFQLMPRDASYGRPISFALVSTAIGLLVDIVLVTLMTIGLGLPFALVANCIILLITVPGLLLEAAICHVLLKLVEAGQYGYSATLRVACYSCGPAICYGIPFVGPLAYLVWSVVCMVVGLKHAQDTSYGKAIFSVGLCWVLLFVVYWIIFVYILVILFAAFWPVAASRGI